MNRLRETETAHRGKSIPALLEPGHRAATRRGHPLPAWMVGEFVGTFLLVFFGCGPAWRPAVLTGAQVGIFQVAIVWGLGIALAIHLTRLAQRRASQSRRHAGHGGVARFFRAGVCFPTSPRNSRPRSSAPASFT